MVKIHLIRHAPTACNYTGKVVDNYDKEGIRITNAELELVKRSYFDEGINFDILKSLPIYTDNTLRCNETAKRLFNPALIHTANVLTEFNVQEWLKKSTTPFWEANPDEFNNNCGISDYDLESSFEMFEGFCKNLESLGQNEVVLITHGMWTRNILCRIGCGVVAKPYDLMTSATGPFGNLDYAEIDLSGDTLLLKSVHTFDFKDKFTQMQNDIAEGRKVFFGKFILDALPSNCGGVYETDKGQVSRLVAYDRFNPCQATFDWTPESPDDIIFNGKDVLTESQFLRMIKTYIVV